MDPDIERRTANVQSLVVRMLHNLDPTGPRSGTDDTAMRVARMYVNELCSGYYVNVAGLFRKFDSEGYQGMVILRDIPVVSLCEHHMVPFLGHAQIGYFPGDKIIGLSKMKRIVDAYGRRLQTQERLTQQIMSSISDNLSARGVIVVIEAEHLCMTIRGVQAPGTKTITSAVSGLFNEDKEGEKEEFLRLISR